MPQTTEALILQYGRVHVGDKEAGRLRRRIRTRATKGDKLAQAFLVTRFKPGDVKYIQAQLRAWLGQQKGSAGG